MNIKKVWNSHLFTLMGKALLGIAFILAGFLKLRHPQDFADSINDYHLLPACLISPLALGLPWFEIVTGALAFYLRWSRLAVLAMSLMLGIFVIALFGAIIQGLKIDCGCFGDYIWQESSPWLVFSRDLLLLGFAIRIYWRKVRLITATKLQ